MPRQRALQFPQRAERRGTAGAAFDKAVHRDLTWQGSPVKRQGRCQLRAKAVRPQKSVLDPDRPGVAVALPAQSGVASGPGRAAKRTPRPLPNARAMKGRFHDRIP